MVEWTLSNTFNTLSQTMAYWFFGRLDSMFQNRISEFICIRWVTKVTCVITTTDKDDLILFPGFWNNIIYDKVSIGD